MPAQAHRPHGPGERPAGITPCSPARAATALIQGRCSPGCSAYRGFTHSLLAVGMGVWGLAQVEAPWLLSGR